jgi:hypothetical protein
MNDDQIIDIWNLFKHYLDKKQVDVIAEKYVDLLADYGVDDIVFKEMLGNDRDLDNAIHYYLEIDSNLDDDNYEDE